MINLTQKELDILNCKYGSRKELYKLELLDFLGVKKCDLDLIDGTINVDCNAEIQRVANLKFLLPNITRKVPRTVLKEHIVLASLNNVCYQVYIRNDGLLYAVNNTEKDPHITESNIKVDDDGTLYTEGIASSSIEFELTDDNGYIWAIGIDSNGDRYAECDGKKKVQYYDEPIKIDWLNDKCKAYMGIEIDNIFKWYPLGVFIFVTPKISRNIVNVTCYDETMYVKQARELQPKLFLKGTNYSDVLKYFLISSGITKINIQATNLTLPSDVVTDYSKNKLEWFNYFCNQINYNHLSSDDNGWLVTKKYEEPSPNNVDHIYEDNHISVISGDLDTKMDYYNVPNVFMRVVSNSQGEMISIYKNEDITSKFSIKNRRGRQITDYATVDNIASQIELDNLVRKLAFNSVQIEQEVSFNTLNMPTHNLKDILDLRHKELKGIFIEQSYSISLKAGGLMNHKVKRLVRLH